MAARRPAGTYRDVEVSRRHPLSQTLGSLIRGQHFLRVQLRGMTQLEVEHLIRSTSRVNPSSSLVETIYGRTEGNPLFVTEVMRMLDQEGGEESQEQLASILEGVRDAIGRRLNGVSEGCNQVLTTASVMGREFDFTLLGALSGDIGEAKLLEFVDEARQTHLLEELSGGRYR